MHLCRVAGGMRREKFATMPVQMLPLSQCDWPDSFPPSEQASKDSSPVFMIFCSLVQREVKEKLSKAVIGGLEVAGKTK